MDTFYKDLTRKRPEKTDSSANQRCPRISLLEVLLHKTLQSMDMGKQRNEKQIKKAKNEEISEARILSL